MNQTMYETILNCIFVFMKKIVIPVNTVPCNLQTGVRQYHCLFVGILERKKSENNYALAR